MQRPDHRRSAAFVQRAGFLLLAALLAGGIACPRAMAAISFAPPVIYDKPGAGGLVAADLDGDGNLDIAVASADSLSLFYGSGDGTLAPRVDLALGDGINDVKVGDVNGDGLPDLILTQGSRVVILLNLGSRTYSHAFNYAIGGGPAGVTVADLNGDGKLDLAVSNSATNNMCVLLNKGDGTFAPAVFYPAGSVPGEIISAYLKGDNSLDLAIGNIVSSNIQLYFGDGTGKFTVGPSYGVGQYSGQVVADDFNGDGKVDLASSNWMGSSISVLFGDGAGNFGPSIFYPGNGYPAKMVSADFDGDGVPDLVHGDGGNSYFTVHPNAGDGNFLPPVVFPSGGSDTRVLAVGDFNSDGLPDVVTSNGGTGNIAVCLNTTPLPSPAIRSLTLDNAAPVGGAQNVIGTVTLTAPAPAGGAGVTISTTNPALTAPASVTVPEGATTAGFALVTAPVTAAQRGTVTVQYNGTGKRGMVTVRAPRIRLAAIDPNPIPAGQTATGRVVAEVPAGPSGFVIPLASDHPEHAVVPATVTIPAGQTTAAFPVITYPSATATDVVVSAGDPGSRTSITLHITDTGLPLPTVPGAVTPPVYNPANGHWYQEVIPAQKITWPDAGAAAEAVSFAGGRGHLATVTSEAENQFVSAYLTSNGPRGNIWLGGSQDRKAADYSEPAVSPRGTTPLVSPKRGENSGWRWVTGEAWGYTPWSPREPNNAADHEDALETNSVGTWNDVALLAGDGAYLIEYEPASAAVAAGNLLVNGSFEVPHRVAPGYTPSLSGWKITRGSVDIVWAASWQQAPGGGSQSLDLVGDAPDPQPSAGTIEQTIATVPGQFYVFAGWMAHNPGIPGPPEGRANVTLNGQPFVELVHHDAAATTTDMRWAHFTYRFRATTAATTLAIADTTYAWDKGGLALDNLSVTPADPNLLVNGSFEQPEIPAGTANVTLRNGGDLPGWWIGGGTVDVVPSLPAGWEPAPGQGSQSLDLVGNPGAGTIEQSFATEPGRFYLFSGWISHAWGIEEGRVNVALNGQDVTQLYHSNTLYGKAAPGDMRWQPFFFPFRATAASTTLTLTDVTGLSEVGGAVLDGLTVAPAQLDSLPAAPAPPPDVRTFAPLYNPANGHWYQVVQPGTALTWDQARIAAEALSFNGLPGHLATLTSAAEDWFVWNTLLQGNLLNWSYLMGGYQDGSAPDYREPAGGWRWVTGEPWSYTNWAPGEPNNGSYIENVLGYWSPEGDHWNDFSGAASGMTYLVEYEAPIPRLDATPLVITPNPVSGGQPAAGQVTLTQPAPAGGVKIFLTSDHPSAVAVPVSITVPAGQKSASFTVTTNPVSVTTPVVVTAGAPTGSGSVTLPVLSSGAPLPNVDGALEPPVYNPANGHWYQEVSPGYGITWQQARDRAASVSYAGLPGHLVTVTSAGEHQFLLAQLPNSTECWIGLYQDRTAPDYSEPAGGWRWITGEPYVWNDWRGEPNNANGNEDFADMRGTAGWNDLSATDLQYGYIIEYEAPPVVPAAPTTLAATAVSPSQVNLSWTDNSDNESGFEVQRKPEFSPRLGDTNGVVPRGETAGVWTKITTVPANTQTFADGSLGGGLHFSYRVRAICAGGVSDWSNEATVDVPVVPALGLDAATYDFGGLIVGPPGSAQTIALANNGNAPLVIDSLTLSGANAGDFMVTAGATSIAPGGKVTIRITFNPAATGPRRALLVITSNAPGSPQTVTLTGSAAPPLPKYVVTDLGALDGIPPQSMQSSAYGLNNAGQVVGQWNLPSTHAHAFLSDATGMHSLAGLADASVISSALGINDAGQIVGYFQSLVDHTTHAFLDSGGVLQNLGTLGGSFSSATAINAHGQVVGASGHAFLWENGVMKDLGTLGDALHPGAALGSEAIAINDQGQIVGASETGTGMTHAFLWENGVMKDLGGLPGYQFSRAVGINASGQVVGNSQNNASAGTLGPAHAFLSDSSGVRDLGTLGSSDAVATGINAHGEVVGFSSTSAGEHAFLYRDGVMSDLNEVVPADSGWVLMEAHAINDAGQIVGAGLQNGVMRAFLLTFNDDPRLAPPTAPSRLTVKMVSTSELDLSWTDTSRNERAFELQVKKNDGDWTHAGTVPANQTSFFHTALESYAHYAYRVRALNEVGASDWSKEASGDTGLRAHADVSPAGDLDFGSQPVGFADLSQRVTITNTGNAPLTLGSITVTGANASEFAVSVPSGASEALATGESVSLSLAFTPAAPGTRSAVLTIAHDGPDSPHTVTLRGTGVGATVRLNPGSLDFGPQLVGTTHGAVTVLLQNSGNAPLAIRSVTIAGANAGDFALAAEGCSGGTLKPGDVCSMSVQFTPGAVGGRSASLVIVDDGPGGSQVVPLAGTGVAPVLTLSAGQLDYGAQRLGTTGSEQSVTLTNSGSAPLTIRSGRISGANAADFTLLTTLSGVSLAPGESRTIRVRFAASAPGDRHAVLTLVTDGAAGSVTVLLGGSGTAPALRLDPAALAFGAQPLGAVADPKPVVVHNDGTAAVDLHDVTIGGANAAEFTIVSDGATGAHLNPGDAATITLRFTPTATGSRTAVLTLNDPADNLHPTVALTGTGTEARVSISPASLDFGPQMLGTAGNSQTVLLQNTGDAPLSVGRVTLAGVNPADFTIIADGWSGERLLPGQVATLNLRFTPTAAGARAAVLTVSDDAAGSPQTVALAGTGTAPVGGLDTSSLSFADQLVGTTSAEQTVTLTNSGTAPLALVAVSLAGANAADFAAALDAGSPTLAPGQSAVVHVRFRPAAAGPRTATLVITDSSAWSPHMVALSGTGTAPSLTFGISRLSGPGSVSFGNQPLGTASATQTLTLTNSGTAALTISGLSLAGAAAGDYQIVADSGAATLAPGASRTLTLRFTPLALGGRAASLTIKDNAAGGSQTVTLAGSGVLPAAGGKGLVLPTSAELVIAAVDGVPASGKTVVVSAGQTVSLKLRLKFKNGAVADVTTDRTTQFSASPARGKFTAVGTWTAQAGDAGRSATLTGSWTLPGSRRRFAGVVTVTVRPAPRRRR